ncbi:MAG: bifunctional 3,4-dihydroxy-2-butanone 4-phosphate synthase/GTP cyclohydrolase II [Helicobacteraceae bacterium]|jgi:3,4-dihydroxy 2-butanone 4-phosphate synthase/GTP cyclohydrolase II|nr:bifunctional 3,4-dihydroxy-2-butanone 4-phosphate synthase/GTP cyclohydrolase II [Helicobacteraceae bacterium]
MTNEVLARVEAAIFAIKAGKMVIMIDDEDRENEGDLVYAAALSTPQMVNFMVSEARGLVCVALEKRAAERLELSPMVAKNTSGHETAFTISVDAASATTGISARERHDTIALLAQETSRAEDFARPGHIFPLIAKEGGVLARIGHTEGAVDICRLAGVAPRGVICEIMNADGTMSRRADLDKFAEKHNLPIVYIADLIEYRLLKERLVERVGSRRDRLFDSDVEVLEWRDHLGLIHRAIVFGEIGAGETQVKFYAAGDSAELLLNDRAFGGLLRAIERLKSGGGVLLLIARGAAKGAAKEIGIGAQILAAIGARKIALLATREFDPPPSLAAFGLEVARVELL